MARPDSTAIVTVEVLKEKQVIAEVRVVLHLIILAEDRPLPFAVEEKNV